ncbi:SLC12A4_6 [Lepeophtheirus salmonis]|uniref:SLC12A4_6 n=1 Tax=Lepeophtheirus salmonis TaxID=72036 RepID=A0A7R8HA27_LEPSM|nr:SLC12A4_6 [Lepeophtheirus salmonis]CAF2950161.1 SLC12A4_6 [Lepeophtheirus salmonis]
MYGEAQAAKFSIQQVIKDEAVKGFADVVVSKDISDGVCHLTQTTGLGGMKPNTVILGWPNSWRKKEEDSWKVFVDSVRYASAAKNGLTCTQRYSTLSRLWRQAQHEDNSIQMKKDLKTFLYHLRIEADVEVVEMQDSDISEYTYERTLLMEQRNEMLKEMRVSDKRKGKMTRRLSLNKGVGEYKVETVIENSRADVPNIEDKIPPKIEEDNELQGNSLTVPKSSNRESSNVRRMHTAVRLNEVIVNKSHDAKLVILNLPSPPKIMGPDKDASYMEFLEVLTEGLERVLMVRGGGREVITIYS